ncbi:IS110 family transposase [Chloroflexales bacterium ZM16-3]|nr:IS110 family transposase [Chloroflexales bacterium ZM16-3]
MQPPADAPADPPADPPSTERSAGNNAVVPQGGDDWASARTICDAVPGIGPRMAEIIIAELGTDMSRFPTAGHAASWARLSPGQNESAGKRRSSRIGKGNRYLRAALVQAAWAAIKVKV